MKCSEVNIRFEDDQIWVDFFNKKFSMRFAPIVDQEIKAQMDIQNREEIYVENDKIEFVSVEDITLKVRTKHGQFLLRRVFDDDQVEVIRFD